MKRLISNFLLFCLLAFFPLGELTRFQLNSGVAVNAIDAITVCILVFNILMFVKNKKYFNGYLTKPLIVFSLVLIISLAVNFFNLKLFEIFVSSLYILRFVSLISVYFFLKNLPHKQKSKLPNYLLISGFIVVILSILQYFLYPDLRNLYYAGWDEHYLRLFSVFFDPNFAGIFLVLYFLFVLDLFLKKISLKNLFPKISLGVLCFITCIEIFLTYSRSAYIALVFGLCFYLFGKGKIKFVMISGIISFLFLVFVLFLTNAPTEGAHLLRIPSSVARIGSFGQALTIFAEKPLLGAGFNAYRYAQIKHGFLNIQTSEISHAGAGTDNSFLFILATTGITGFVCFIYLIFRMIKYTVETKNKYSSVTYSSIIALAASSMFINSLFYAPLMLWVWMLLGIIEST